MGLLSWFPQHAYHWHIGDLLISNVMALCILQLCWQCLPHLLIFWWSFRVSYRIVSSANKDTLTFSLHICIPFICFSCLTGCEDFQHHTEESGECDHPCPVPCFSGNASCSSGSWEAQKQGTSRFWINVSWCGDKDEGSASGLLW